MKLMISLRTWEAFLLRSDFAVQKSLKGLKMFSLLSLLSFSTETPLQRKGLIEAPLPLIAPSHTPAGLVSSLRLLLIEYMGEYSTKILFP